MSNISLSLFKDTELLSLLLVMAAAAVLIILLFRFVPIQWKNDQKNEMPDQHLFLHSAINPVYTRTDWLAITLIAVLYGIVSFWQLGSSVFPSTTWQPTKEKQSIILELTEGTHFDAVYAIYGEGDNNHNLTDYQLGFHNMEISGSNDKTAWTNITALNDGSIYQYMINNGDWDYKYIRIVSINPNDTLTEIGFKAIGEDRLLKVKVDSDEAPESQYPAYLIIDEQDRIAMNPTYMNESYFDEIYHPRNAYEIVSGQYMYASVHPLLGTSLIALSIKMFGMNPLAWRIPGVIFGIMLVPLFYAVLKLLFSNRKWAIFGTVLFVTDFMHLTTSRIATLEPFSVFWILLMFYFMIRYFKTSIFDTPLKEQLKLLLWCGITMGLGIATKWTACYSAVGLAILLFTKLIAEYLELRKAKKTSLEPLSEEPEQLTIQENDRAEYKRMSSCWKQSFLKTIGFCFLFFILIPIVIYCLAYIPCRVWRSDWSIANVWKQVEYMYRYHVNLQATHPYQSSWYQWILDIRPIWYYGRASADGLYHSIACFSNPLICWAGFFAVPYTFWCAIKKRDSAAWIISIGYLTAFLPWVSLVKRCVFAYHFYPSSIFMIFSIVYAARAIMIKHPKKIFLIYFFAIACAVLFLMFLPATAGFGTENSYIKFLEWLPSWYFG
ncbi:MAG: phospholipid carrier-dependent glycosyltransferase [Erysipelotrichia bacterium]|nr:phospholipid carrier-dependent glycosyltransferase [Erysipelotrichia bacterium]